ncbi:esterase-like activity of phytase family protein [Nioella nitratireducens]|uniref:esterase-like activity of phytase family protein n=1 Tax=Nioella nitratireducens TaxID=1287720 RepID=UPI0008FD6AEB|nr:esterase-like activity of phytase family protein [Nioella nitratireducens]
MTHRFLLLSTAVLAVAGSPALADMNFNRVASFPVARNAPDAEETSSEIIAATADGMTLVYTDSLGETLGFIDIADPANPVAGGALELDGEPTSVAVIGQTAYVGINTSADYVNTSGHLQVVDVASHDTLANCDLGGQPDSVAAAPDASFIAVAIENERNEDLGDGRVGQMPAGYVVILPLAEGMPQCDEAIFADVTGLAEIAPEDPEPEFVSINAENEIVLTMQENNHMVILSAAGEVLNHFSAGAVDLEGIDTREEGALVFTDSQPGRLREPDSVTWIDADHFAIANEGDMDGGSRGWTIFNQDGTEVYESGTSFEQALIQIGHYPEQRSGNKGVEPESVTFGVFDGTPLLFVGSERGSVVGVYDVTDPATPALLQLLPSGIGPEGYVVIPERGLLVSANEEDLGLDGGARSHVMIFERQNADAVYPHLTSAGMDELTGWGALSGLANDPETGLIYAVNDSFYAMQPTIFVIDPSMDGPSQIVDAIRVTRGGQPAQLLDMEGITLDGEGGFWIASEGRTDRLVPHALYHVGADGEIEDYVTLPAELQAVERRFGFEGITMVGDTLWMAVQREWADDPAHQAKLVSYNTLTRDWGAVRYELTTPDYGWVGLSEIEAHGDYVYLIERDNQLGELARTKLVTRVAIADLQPAPLGGDLPVVPHEMVVDLMPYMASTGGFVVDKVEGLTIMEDGTMWIVTDNDGVDDSSGETMFFSIPPM